MIALEFCIEDPKGGLRFISTKQLSLDKTDNEMYLISVDHNAHYWFPCVSSYNEPCTWKIEVVVEEHLQVITSGNLIEVETMHQSFNAEPNAPDSTINKTSLKKYHYFLQIPTCAPNIGLAIGRFDTTSNETISEISYYFDEKLNDLVKHTASFLHEVFEFFEELFSIHFPYGSYKQVFVPDILDDCLSFASMSILK